MESDRLAEQNPWWQGGGFLANDRHLVRYDGAPLKLAHPVEQEINLGAVGVQVLRGPRQVGKTTLLKRLVRNLIAGGTDPRAVMYAALDVADIRTHVDLADAIKAYVRIAPEGKRRFIFLDEVTFCPEWATGVKVAADLGLLDDALLLATGSHALDLKVSSERLPGRRGELEASSSLDMGPYPFSEVARGLGVQARALPADSWKPRDLEAAARENAIRFPGYQEAFSVFLRGGGMPRALAEMVSGHRFTVDSAATYRDAVVGDVLRSGRNEGHLRDVVRAVAVSRGSPVTWHGLAERLAVGSKNTVSDYLEAMQACYLVAVLPQPVSLGSRISAPRKARKVHFRDPFLRHVFTAWSMGSADPWQTAATCLSDPHCTGALVESAVAGALVPHFGGLMHWRNSGEVDVIGVRDSGEQVYFEIKYQSRVTSGDKKHLKAAGGGVLVSRDSLALDAANAIVILPAPLLLLSLPRRG